MLLPAAVGDYTDFYASVFHATNVGTHVPAGQPAAAQLQVRADRLPRPGLVARRAAARPSRRPQGQTEPRRERRRPSARAARSTTSWRSASSSGRATRSASPIPIAEAEEHTLRPRAWSTTGRRATSRSGSTSRSGPFLAKNFATIDLALGRDARGARAVPRARVRAARGRSGAAAVPVARRRPRARRLRHHARGLAAARARCASAGSRPCASPQQPRATSTGPSRRCWRTTPATAATCGPGDLLASGTVSGPDESEPRLPARADLARQRAAHAADRREAALPRGRRRGDPARLLRARRLRADRLRRVPGRGSLRPMAKVESLGIKRLESVHYYVHDLERSRRFYTEHAGLRRDRRSSAEELTERGRQAVGRCSRPATCAVVCIAAARRGRPRVALPREAPRRRRHADLRGRGRRARRSPCSRSAAARRSTTSRRFTDDGGTLRLFSITTPFGDTTFRFIERRGYRALFPGFVAYDQPRGGANRFGFTGIDHVTSNFQTHEADARSGSSTCWASSSCWEVAVPHHRRRPAATSTARASSSIVMWDPALGREVREQRALAPVLQGLADQHLQRGAPRRRRAARRARGRGHHPVRARPARARRRVHADARQLLRHAARAARSGSASARSTRTSRCCASSRSWSTATATTRTCCRSS